MTKEEFLSYDKNGEIRIHECISPIIACREEKGWYCIMFLKTPPTIDGYIKAINWIRDKFPKYNEEGYSGDIFLSYYTTLYGPYPTALYIRPEFDK